MNLRSKLSLGLASLVVAATGSFVAASAQPSPSPQTPAPQNKPDTKPEKKAEEKHPRLQKAVEELKEAKQHLEKAPHDFGGHKAEAIKAVNEAIKQLELAVKFDKN